MLGDLDIYAVSAANEMRYSKKYDATWKDLAEMYKDAQANDPNFLPSKELEKIVHRLDNKKIADMDLNALQDLYKAAVGLRTEFYNRNNVINDDMNRLFAEVYTDSKKAVRDMDAVMCLRLQLERQQAGLLPDLREYSKRFCLTTAHMELARPGAHIMHPGPILRGLDVSDALADSSQSLILDQVSAGVSVRMAVLYLLATRPDIKDNL